MIIFLYRHGGRGKIDRKTYTDHLEQGYYGVLGLLRWHKRHQAADRLPQPHLLPAMLAVLVVKLPAIVSVMVLTCGREQRVPQ